MTSPTRSAAPTPVSTQPSTSTTALRTTGGQHEHPAQAAALPLHRALQSPGGPGPVRLDHGLWASRSPAPFTGPAPLDDLALGFAAGYEICDVAADTAGGDR